MNLIEGSWDCTGSLAAPKANLVWKIARPLPCNVNDRISLAAMPLVSMPGCISQR